MNKQTNSNLEKKVKVGLVQVNNSFSNQTYFPYSVGLLQAYAQKHLKNINDFEFLLPIYKRIPIEKCISNLSESDITFFSTYVWNTNISLEIAKNIKKIKSENINVIGGCGFSKKDVEKFLKENSFIDIVCRGEGEKVFSSILENYEKRTWEEVPSISYINKEGKVINNSQGKRIIDLNEIPSPYLSGVFDSLIKENPQQTWLGLWETNRGCPFSCSFCEWGEEYHRNLRRHDLEKLFDEIDWFSNNKIEFIFCCDANFGLMKRDLEIVNYVAENKKKYNYPKRLSVQNTKNATERSYNVNKKLEESGLSKGVNLAFQSLNPKTLKSIGRKNISNKSFQELQQRFNHEGITTFSDIILGLPNETYETFVKGISSLIEKGQKNRIQFINLSVLPNSEMANLDYQKKYGFNIVEGRTINIHGSLTEENEVFEKQKLVVGTNTMPSEDWVKTRAFSWMASLLYFDKLLQIPFTILNREYSIGYDELIETFLESNPKNPILSDVYSSFTNKAKEIRRGEPEFCESKDWLNIWWPADELTLVRLCTENKLDTFYQESEQILKDFLKQKKINYNPSVLTETLLLNRNLIKLPFQDSDLTMKLSYNILEVYKKDLIGKSETLKEIENNCLINKTGERWDSWNDWCQKVIWYGNKKGDYIYPYQSI